MQKILLTKQYEIEEEVFNSAKTIIDHYANVLKNNKKIILKEELFYTKEDIKNIIKFFIIIDFCKGNINIIEHKILFIGLSKFQKIKNNTNRKDIDYLVEKERKQLKAEFHHFLKCFQEDFSIVLEMQSKLSFPYLFVKNNYPTIKKTLEKIVFEDLEKENQNTSRPFKEVH